MCAYGIAYMDGFYLKEFHDTNYALRRENLGSSFNCLEQGKHCFCHDMGVPLPKRTIYF